MSWPRAAATSLQFLTRLPVPGGASADPASFAADLKRALALFPLAGALIGALAGAVLLLAALVLPLPLAVLLALAAEARITGALHEDALADACDGLGGGRDTEAVLRIMKDSRIGAFGVLGLGFAVALRAGGLMAQADALDAALVLVVSGCLGRLLMLAAMALVPPVAGHAGLAATVAPAMGPGGLALAAGLASPVLLLGLCFDPRGVAVACLAGAAFLGWYARMLRRRLGGGTGDLYGAAGMAGIVLATLAFVPDAAP